MRSNDGTVAIAGLELDRRFMEVRFDGRDVRLTRTEFELLWTLAQEPGRAFRRGELLANCLGEDSPSAERTIDVHIRMIRQKLGHGDHLIETVRGTGYRFLESDTMK